MQADVADVNVRSTIDPVQVTAWPLTVQMQVSGKVEAVQGKLRLEAAVSDGTPWSDDGGTGGAARFAVIRDVVR